MSAAPNPKSHRALSALAGLGILLVVIGHAEGRGPAQRGALGAQYPAYGAYLSFVAWIYTFHMPLFFALSGFQYQRFTVPKSPRTAAFLRDKALRLLVPYLLISSLAFPIKAVLGNFAQRPVALSFASYVHALVFPWDNTILFFWFLPTLFLHFVWAHFILSRSPGPATDLALLVLCVASFAAFPHHPLHGESGALLNLAGAAHNCVFFTAGVLAAKHAWPGGRGRAAAGPLLLLLSAGLFARGLLETQAASASLCLATLGIVGSARVAASLREGVLSWLGDRSYQVYLLCWFPQVFVRIAAEQAGAPVITAIPASIGLAIAVGALAHRSQDALPFAVRVALGFPGRPGRVVPARPAGQAT